VTENAEGLTLRLAEFVTTTRFEDLPPEVVAMARLCVGDWLGVTLAGSREAGPNILAAALPRSGPGRSATLIGRRRRATPAAAALINGVAGHVLDFDDTHLPTVLHATGAVTPAVLALAEDLRCGGRRTLTAFALGFELAARVACAVYPWHYDIGWHITGTVGALGAAAGCAALLGLDSTRTAHAVGIAASQAAGLREMFGSMTKSLHPGKAAVNGLQAALWARAGFTSSLQAIEAPRGFGSVLSPQWQPEAALEDLGSSWQILRNGFKPFPCGVVSHPAIEGALRLRADGVLPGDVRELRLRCHPLVGELTGKREPRTGLEGKFSVYYCVATALVLGVLGPQQFTDDAVTQPAVRHLREKVTLSLDPQLAVDEAYVEAVTADGRAVSQYVEHTGGSPANPLTATQLQEKFQRNARAVVDAPRIPRLTRLAFGLGEVPDVRRLMALMRLKAAPGKV